MAGTREGDTPRDRDEPFRSLFQNMLDGFAHCRIVYEDGRAVDWEYLEVNDAFVRLTGLENVRGRRVTEVIPGIFELNPELLETYARVAEGGAPEVFEIDFKPLGLYLSVSAYCPRVGEFVAVFDDITERKADERRIRHLNRVYAMLSDVNHTIVRERRIEVIYDRACRIAVERGGFLMAWIGLLDQETGKVEPVAHAGTAEGYLEGLNIVLGADPGADGPTAASLRSGRPVTSLDVATDPAMKPWREAALRRGYRSSGAFPLVVGGRPFGAFNLYSEEPGFFVEEEVDLLADLAADISLAAEMHQRERERERVVAALQESEERFRELAETVREVFWIITPDKTRMLYVSPGYEALWGRTCESLYANPGGWLEAVHPEDRDQVGEAARTRQVLGTYDEEYRVVRPDGSIRWIRDRAFPVFDSEGRLIRMVGAALDVTASRELEEQLRQAQKMDALGQLAGGVAHDFNNILGVIQMLADLLVSEEPSEAQREISDEISRATRRASNLTRQLLLFSRRQAMESRELDLNEVVLNIARMLRRILGADIALQLECCPRPLRVRADVGMMDQVLINLAVNSRDAMPSGGRLVLETSLVEAGEARVQASGHARLGTFARLAVRDNGCGIPPEVLPRIFEPFFTTKEPGSGTGLGLATVQGIVEQHQGWIDVASEVDRGTTFQIFLPLSVAEKDESEDPRRVPAPGGDETILLVEDEAALRALVRRVLAGLGYRVIEAGSGPAALLSWEREGRDVSLLLTDLVMPGRMTGVDLAERLQQRNPAIKVLYMSGYSPDYISRKARLEEGVNFLNKPFEAAELARVVRAALDG